MHKSHDGVVSPDERIVKVTVTHREKPRSFYAIHDEYLDYWRSVEPIDDDRAWTRDPSLRAQFPSREAAGKELRSIWQYRRQKACA